MQQNNSTSKNDDQKRGSQRSEDSRADKESPSYEKERKEIESKFRSNPDSSKMKRSGSSAKGSDEVFGDVSEEALAEVDLSETDQSDLQDRRDRRSA